MDLSTLSGNNAAFLEDLYERYLQNPDSIDPSFVKFFRHLDYEVKEEKEFLRSYKSNVDIDALINKYRSQGHLVSDLNPLYKTSNELSYDMEDLERQVNLGGKLGLECTSVKQVLEIMKEAHCKTIGLEFMHISSTEEREWLQSKLENCDWRRKLTKEEKVKIFKDIMEVELFENYLHVKFPGAKRFSIEGAESSIVGLESMVEHSSNCGAEEVLIGMAHRGRLNVLTKVMKKSYTAMLYEFQGNDAHPREYKVSGDVKYHLGASCDRRLGNGKKIHLSLSANPSHLEAVNSVLMGKVRCKQDMCESNGEEKVLGILIHGDAAFAGQGVVHECFNLNNVKNYSTGGVLHIIINNQIGFTTNPVDARGYNCPAYAGVAYNIPIFHLNGDDPEAVFYCSMLATEYRYKFKKDVILSIKCYRKYGHNEGDEPRFTQPRMYAEIARHKSPMSLYAEKLISEGIVNDEEIQNIQDKFKKHLDSEFAEVKNYFPNSGQYYQNLWKAFERPEVGTKFSVVFGVDLKNIKNLAKKLAFIPGNFLVHNKVEKLLLNRLKAVEDDSGIDWGNAEHLAFASLLKDGINIRLVGQDSRRGTFSHRHAVLVDQEREERYTPLNNIDGQGRIEVIDSVLSEYAAMGFEYGYSLSNPKNLVLWEAQFGDFANGAQIIIDQFIASAETKWLQSSGLVLLLPHGYEGQGPEHSSARIERFLQLCAEDNIQVANCSTPANYFHILRRQVLNEFRKPLVIFTPKSLLRHKETFSLLSDIGVESCFQSVLTDNRSNTQDVKKLIFCSGKIYYDLMQSVSSRSDIALVRIEQLYPFPLDEVRDEIFKYDPKRIIWCQEEPKNMGCWAFILQCFHEFVGRNIEYAGRKASASSAVGYLSVHLQEQQEIVDYINS